MSNEEPRVDVVIVTFNSASTISRCVESLNLISSEYHLTVVDNGSTDETLDIVKALNPKARLLSGHGNIGFGAAVNLGAETGAGDVVMVLNPDAHLEPGINVVIDAAIERSAIATGHMRGEDGSLRSNVFRYPRLRSVLKVSKASVAPHVVADNIDRERSGVLPVDYIEGSLMVMPRHIWRTIGGFSSSYFMYGEDRDLSHRALKYGVATIIVNEIAFTHVGGFSPQRQNWYALGILTFFYENRPVSAPLVFVMLAVKFAVKALVARCRSNPQEAQASFHALLSVLSSLRHRRKS